MNTVDDKKVEEKLMQDPCPNCHMLSIDRDFSIVSPYKKHLELFCSREGKRMNFCATWKDDVESVKQQISATKAKYKEKGLLEPKSETEFVEKTRLAQLNSEFLEAIYKAQDDFESSHAMRSMRGFCGGFESYMSRATSETSGGTSGWMVGKQLYAMPPNVNKYPKYAIWPPSPMEVDLH